MRFPTAALALVIATPVAAESVKFPITIPQECFELAQREGVPTVLENRVQATRAKLKLASLKNSDHLVRECRAAVHRAQEAMAAAKKSPSIGQGGQAGFEAGVQANAIRSPN
jgi:hypothetical protein